MKADIAMNQYAPNVFSLKSLGLSTLAREAFGIVLNWVKISGKCYVGRVDFSKRLHCALGSVSRAITELVNAGLIKRTGLFHNFLFPFVEITPLGRKYAHQVGPFVPVAESLPTPHQIVTHPSQNGYTEEKREKHIKEQTTVVVPPSKKNEKEFSANEKIALKQKLKAIGVHKQVIDRLVDKYSMERINAQIEHLQEEIERGVEIRSPAAWLIAAIEKNFQIPKELDKTVVEEKRQEKSLREALVIAQKAKQELGDGNLQEAQKLSEKSLLIAENTLAKEVQLDIGKKQNEKEKIERARQIISPEKLQLIRQEEEQKQLQTMRRFLRRSEDQIRDNPLFKGAVETLINQRLLAVV